MTTTPDPSGEQSQDKGEARFSFTDKRKVDPKDGSVRPSAAEQPASADAGAAAPSADGSDSTDPLDAEAAELFAVAAQQESGETGSADGATGADARVAELEKQVADLSEELKREQAEYVNSRRRIEASAQAETQAAVGRVLSSLVGVLDDVELGRKHGDIVEGTPFHSITTRLEEILGSQGLERFGAEGDEFDPNLHEALMHEDSDEATSTTVKLVMQPGYTLNGRVLRPARVGTQGPA